MVFENMRKFHNNIKKMYLDKYIIKETNLLDLASGKGGDLFKWKSNKNIKSVVGYDIDERSVKEAIRRRNNMKINKNIKFNVLDLSKNILKCNTQFDCITSMFAFHYFFESKETLYNVTKSIDNCSKSGTILILILFDRNKVEEKLKKDLFYKNKNFYLELETLTNKKYGVQLNVFIKGSVLDTPTVEYLVYPEFLIEQMNKINFHLVEITPFEKLYTKEFNMNKEEKELSFLNNVYIFVKK
jgi:mRNA (guanine-N7-)-methyltransferase